MTFVISCKEEVVLDPCRYLSFEVIISNQTEKDAVITAFVTGCEPIVDEYHTTLNLNKSVTFTEEFGTDGFATFGFIVDVDGKHFGQFVSLKEFKVALARGKLTINLKYDQDYYLEML